MSEQNFNKLIDNYSSQVLNTATRILGDQQSAQDVHQEVFLAIWRRWHKYDHPTNWSAYLYRSTVRKAIEFAKRSRRTPFTEHQPENIAQQKDPDEQLKLTELQQKLAKHLARLPKRQADTFVLSKIEGLKNEEIAKVLNCSENTVRVHLHRATKKLSKDLSDYL